MIIKFLYIILLLTPILAHSQWLNKWEKVNIAGRYSNGPYLDVYFLPSDRNLGWICGIESQVSFTKDGGDNWETVNVDENNTLLLESIHFTSPSIGYTSGKNNDDKTDGVIYKSIDSGRTWVNISPRIGKGYTIWGCYFYDDNNGVAVASTGRTGCEYQIFFKTTDGGQNWTWKEYKIRNGTKLSDVRIDGTTGYGQAISSGYVWETTDYGSNWEIDFETGPIDWAEELAYQDSSFIIPISESCEGDYFGYGGMLFTTDKGQTIQTKYLENTRNMFGSFLVNKTTGWVCGVDKSVFFTCDAGNNWENLNCGIDGDLDDMFFIDDTTGWVVGDDVFRTRNVTEVNKVISRDTVYICRGELAELKIQPPDNLPNTVWSTCGRNNSLYTGNEGDYRAFAYASPCDTAFIYDFEVIYYPDYTTEILSNNSNYLCVGDTVQLKVDTVFSNVLWNTGDTTSYLNVTKSGNYIVQTTSPDGCIKYDSMEVVINPLPKPNIISLTKNDFCIGDSMLLQSEYDHYIYRWYNEASELISKEKTITAKIAGEYKLIAESEFGCIDSSAAFTVFVRIDSNRLSIEYTISEPFIFDTLSLGKTICQKVSITNKSDQDYQMQLIKLKDKYYFAAPPSDLPNLGPYETVEFEICFDGDSIGYFEDIVEIPDICSPHFFKVEGEVAPFNFEAISKCDVPWTFTSIRIDKKHIFESSSPFPNPSNGSLAISYMEFTPNEDKQMKVYLYDSKGLRIGELERRMSEIEYYSNGKLERGEYLTEVAVPTGIYFIVIEGKDNTESKPIVITR
ncbi:MAG: YCF48-related protein [Candidatus Kapaibacterium sp.]